MEQRWRDGERRLYPLVLTDPDAYRRCVLAVRELADELRSATTLELLAEAYRDAAPRAAAVLEASGGPAGGGAAEMVADAAFALRHRELAAELAAAEVARRISEAAASGVEWVVLRESGHPELAVLGGYRRVEMHLPDGAGLHSFVEMEAGADRPTFVIESLPLDPLTGARRGEVRRRVELADPEAWARALEQLRRSTPSGHGEGRMPPVDKRFL
jgi:hypothetical protein